MPTDLVATPRRRLRRSELEAIDQCLFRANAVYQQGFVDQGDESLRGIAFHACTKHYVERLAALQLSSDHEEARLAFIDGIAETACASHLVDEVHELFFDRFVPRFELDLAAYLVAEAVQFDERFSWIPDLVYAYHDRLRIRDWKSYWRGYTDAQAAQEFQPRFYLRQAMKVWPGFPRYEFEFVFVRVGQTAVVSYSPAELEAVDDHVEAILAKYDQAQATNHWPATPGTHCRFCRLQCPIADDPRRLPLRLLTEADAGEAFGRLLVLEQETQALKHALGGWCSEHDRVVVGGEELAHRPRTIRTYPMKGVMDALTGFDLEDAGSRVMVSQSAIAPLVHPKKSPEPLRDALASLVKETQSWQLRHQKAGAVNDDSEGETTD